MTQAFEKTSEFSDLFYCFPSHTEVAVNVSGRRSRSAFFLLFLLFGSSRGFAASPISDFQARLAQTLWCLGQAEAILRSQPESSVPVPTPEALASYLTLASENIAALGDFASARVTDEQRRIIAEGVRGTARAFRAELSLANNRGLAGASATLSALESSCRARLAGS